MSGTDAESARGGTTGNTWMRQHAKNETRSDFFLQILIISNPNSHIYNYSCWKCHP